MVIRRLAIGAAILALVSPALADVPTHDFELADGLIQAEQYEQALALLKKIDISDSETQAHTDLLLGRIFLAVNKPAKSLEFFEHAGTSSLDVEAESYLGMAEANLALGKLGQARMDASFALKTDPDLIVANLVMAMVDQRVGHGVEALARLRKLHQNRPDDETVAVILARFVALQDGTAGGVAELQPFLNRVPTAAAAQDAMGQLLWEAGRKNDAVGARARARDLYRARGQSGRADAMSAWLKAIDPNGEIELASKPPAKPSDPPPQKPEHRVVAVPIGGLPPTPVPEAKQPPEPAHVPNIRNDKTDEPPPLPAVPRPVVKSTPIAAVLPIPEPLPFAPGSPIMTGSGIVLEGGRLVITNRHVVDGMRTIAVRNGTGHVRMGRVVKVSEDDDLALLEIDKPFPEGAVTPIADIVDPRPGRAAIVMGYPMISLLGDEQPALTEGVVAKSVGLSDDPNTFQMTTKINKGNSGGPVFDTRGHLLGVAVGKTDTAGIYQKSGVLMEDINIGIKGSRILRFIGKPAADEKMPQEMTLEDLYQRMLPRAVLIAAQK